jgi:hypothetical protein
VLRISDAALAARYGAPLVLVRPDHHVAWRGAQPPAHLERLIDLVRGAGVDGRDGVGAEAGPGSARTVHTSR